MIFQTSTYKYSVILQIERGKFKKFFYNKSAQNVDV